MLLLRIVAIAVFVFMVTSSTPTTTNNSNCFSSAQDQLLLESFKNIQIWYYSKMNDECPEKIGKIETELSKIKHELEKTTDLINKLESRSKEHHDSEVLFESLKKWVNTKLDEVNNKTDLRFKRLEESMIENKIDLNNVKETVGKPQSNDESALLKHSVDQLQKKVDNVEDNLRRLNVFEKETKESLAHQLSLIQKQESTTTNVKNETSNCITDIKVSARESSAIWKGSGYGDEGYYGYFLTGVDNWNRDTLADTAHRRKILFKKNNAWHPLHE